VGSAAGRVPLLLVAREPAVERSTRLRQPRYTLCWSSQKGPEEL